MQPVRQKLEVQRDRLQTCPTTDGQRVTISEKAMLMNRLTTCLLGAATLVLLLPPNRAEAAGFGYHRPVHQDRAARWYNANVPWHGPYYQPVWGQPVALVVPPTANFQTNFSWGVGRTTMKPLNHQFGRPYPGPFGGANPLAPPPHWPSNTNQFGFYSVRGPW